MFRMTGWDLNPNIETPIKSSTSKLLRAKLPLLKGVSQRLGDSVVELI
jgi:hypothetical protein